MAKNYRSELVGTFGNPIDENPTGVVMEAGFAVKGLDWRYITMKVEPGDLKAAMEGMKAVQMRGLNLTIPFKVEGVKLMDELSPAAEIIGAINVVVNRDGKLWGENTDGKGLLTSFRNEGVPPAPCPAPPGTHSSWPPGGRGRHPQRFPHRRAASRCPGAYGPAPGPRAH